MMGLVVSALCMDGVALMKVTDAKALWFFVIQRATGAKVQENKTGSKGGGVCSTSMQATVADSPTARAFVHVLR